jgi:toxin YoeB
MSSYSIRFSEKAREDIRLHKKSGNKSLVDKITFLLEKLLSHPYTGTGKPELLKHSHSGCWSRRIKRENRLIYNVDEGIINILPSGVIICKKYKAAVLIYSN